MSDDVTIFIDGTPVHARRDDTVLNAIGAWRSDVAQQLRDRQRALTDSRGLAASLDSLVYAGAIFRLVSARQLTDESSSDGQSD